MIFIITSSSHYYPNPGAGDFIAVSKDEGWARARFEDECGRARGKGRSVHLVLVTDNHWYTLDTRSYEFDR